MSSILYDQRCRCKETKKKKRKVKHRHRSEGKPILYPESSKIKLISKTFKMRYHKKLSLTAKFILNSFQNKYIYYAIDDILYLLNSNLNERDSLLAVLYSPIISLQNNFSVNFFDIWIHEVYIDQLGTHNKFLKDKSQTVHQTNYITIKFFYQIKPPAKKLDSLW